MSRKLLVMSASNRLIMLLIRMNGVLYRGPVHPGESSISISFGEHGLQIMPTPWRFVGHSWINFSVAELVSGFTINISIGFIGCFSFFEVLGKSENKCALQWNNTGLSFAMFNLKILKICVSLSASKVANVHKQILLSTTCNMWCWWSITLYCILELVLA